MVRSLGYLAILVISVAIGLMRLKNHTSDDLAEDVDHWHCPKCHEPVPQSFDKCWNCGAGPNQTKERGVK